MSMQLYNDTCFKISKRLTVSYSTSFSWGIKAFKPEYREPIFAIYSYVRVADEIVDTFHEFDKKELLKKFEEDTWEAIEKRVSTNPVLQAFQETMIIFTVPQKWLD
jgi:phytoene synthase